MLGHGKTLLRYLASMLSGLLRYLMAFMLIRTWLIGHGKALLRYLMAFMLIGHGKALLRYLMASMLVRTW